MRITLDTTDRRYGIHLLEYVKGQTFLGQDELCLNNKCYDSSYLEEYHLYELLRVMGEAVPGTPFCQLSANEELIGFYLSVEGLDDTFLEDTFGEAYENGIFYKM